MVFELKEKITTVISAGAPEPPSDTVVKEDALSALINLGYKNTVAKDAIDRVYATRGGEVTLEVLLPESLKILSG